MGGRNKEQKERVVEMFRMKVEGMSYQDIADHFGTSRQFVQQSIATSLWNKMQSKKWDEIIYPNLKSWMIVNEFNMKRLVDAMKIENYKGQVNYLYKKLRGELSLSLGLARKIAEVTGMSIDECFELEPGKEEMYKY